MPWARYEIEVITSGERPDLDGQARAAFRGEWPEFIFHGPVSAAHIGRVEECFAHYDILLLDPGEVVAGGWGVPIQWDGSVASLPGGYDGSLGRRSAATRTEPRRTPCR